METKKPITFYLAKGKPTPTTDYTIERDKRGRLRAVGRVNGNKVYQYIKEGGLEKKSRK